jgi:hypothetical protein
MPPGFLCITQEAANNAAANVRELAAKDAKIATLEEGIRIFKEVTVPELQKLNADNVARLTERMHATEVKFAETSGKLGGVEAALVRTDARLEQCMKKRAVKVGLINF